MIPLGLTLSIPNPATGQSYKHKKGPWIENKFSSQSPLYVCDSVGIRARLQRRRFQSAAGKEPLGEIPIGKQIKGADAPFLVIPLGFEPKAHSLEGCCSIQLSYGTNTFLLSVCK